MEKNKINIAEILKDCPKKPRWDPVGMNIGSLKVLREVEHVRMSLEKAINFVYNEHTAHLLGTTDPYTKGGSE